MLKNSNIGLWAIEIDEDAEPRMYADGTMLRLLGVETELTPEQLYSAWYDNVHPEHYDAVADGVEKMTSGAHAEIQYQWFLHGEEIYVRCGGMRNYKSAYHDVGIPFSKAFGDYIERDVAPEDRERLRSYISLEYIAGQLKTQANIEVKYRDIHSGSPQAQLKTSARSSQTKKPSPPTAATITASRTIAKCVS